MRQEEGKTSAIKVSSTRSGQWELGQYKQKKSEQQQMTIQNMSYETSLGRVWTSKKERLEWMNKRENERGKWERERRRRKCESKT